MKRTIVRRTEITIETIEITTVRNSKRDDLDTVPKEGPVPGSRLLTPAEYRQAGGEMKGKATGKARTAEE